MLANRITYHAHIEGGNAFDRPFRRATRRQGTSIAVCHPTRSRRVDGCAVNALFGMVHIHHIIIILKYQYCMAIFLHVVFLFGDLRIVTVLGKKYM